MKPSLTLAAVLLVSSALSAQPKNIELRAKVSGFVESIHVKAGDKIKKGDLLVQLDARELKAKFAEAEAEFERSRVITAQTETRFVRAQLLLERKAITKEDYDLAHGEHLRAQEILQAVAARHELARSNLSDTKIHAPVDGIADSLRVTAGELVKANEMIVMVIAAR